MTKNQREAIQIRHSVGDKCDFVFSWGSVRSGKSWYIVQDVILYIAKMRKNGMTGGMFLIVGFSVKQLKDAVIPIFSKLLGDSFNYSEHLGEIYLFDNKILLMSGRQAIDFARFRSYSTFGAYVNEATNIHINTWNELIARQSESIGGIEPVLFADLNPSSKAHYLYIRYFQDAKNLIKDKQGNPIEWVTFNRDNRAMMYHFTILDNAQSKGGHLSDRY